MAENIPGIPPVAAPAPPPSPLGGAPQIPGLPGAPRIAGVSQPLANLGNQVAATAKISNAIKELTAALPMIPMGSELHTAIFKVIPQLTKAIEGGKPDQAMQLQELIKSTREAASGGPMAALGRIAPGGAPPAIAPQPQPTPALPMAA
jgi:hypothetical protein